MLDSDIKSFVKKLSFTGKYDTRDIFRDVIALAVHFINATMLLNKDYAVKFDDVMKKYDIQEQNKMWHILLDLIELYNKQINANDLLTAVFGELGLGNKHTGQFFTPTSISDAMAKLTGIDENIIKEKGYITLHEPTSGAGGMILAYARELKAKGYSLARNLLVQAWDIDILCTYMTYLQLAMYDIPAVVVNGNTLTLEEKFVLYTPAYYVFKKLEKEGKLNTPICSKCANFIDTDLVESKIDSEMKLCRECNAVEQKLLLFKKVVDL